MFSVGDGTVHFVHCTRPSTQPEGLHGASAGSPDLRRFLGVLLVLLFPIERHDESGDATGGESGKLLDFSFHSIFKC